MLKLTRHDTLRGVLLLLVTLTWLSAGAVRLPAFFSDHMVLQRNQPIRVWGWAEAGERLRVSLGVQTASAVAGADGRWAVQLKPQPAGGPYTLHVRGKKEVELQDVMIGDVWFCSGQSNMEWKIESLDLPKDSVAGLANPLVRLITVPHLMASLPQHDLPEGPPWKVCTPDDLQQFSAVATYFARFLQPAAGVPLGLVVSAWGGTDIEPWMSAAAMGQWEKHSPALKRLEKVGEPAAYAAYTQKRQALWNDSLELADQGLQQQWYQLNSSIQGWDSITLPGVWDQLGYKGEGVGWFKKEVTLTPEQAGQPVVVSLGPVHNRAVLYVNGQQIDGPRKAGRQWLYIVSAPLLKPGNNLLAVKVYKLWSYGGFTGKAEDMFLSTTTSIQSLAGTWHFKPGYLGKNPMLSQGPNTYPASLFNAMVHPFTSMPVKGVIWYQGENNVGRPGDYADHLKAMIRDWRRSWKDSTLPFLVVQLPNFKGPASTAGNYALIREAQQQATSLPGVQLAVTIDVGDSLDIHPQPKEPVGHRLALLARRHVYGESTLVAEGPCYQAAALEGSMVIISFANTRHGLVVPDAHGYLYGFELAGEDQRYFPARAAIRGGQVEVQSSDVSAPKYIRYAWADNPRANLYNAEGLPAAPFRRALAP